MQQYKLKRQNGIQASAIQIQKLFVMIQTGMLKVKSLNA